ncbi:unnamed protein product [Notodromas monacha]|uniref:Angiotensin-converting enzyme n=1 Tax=Notodromas monacha TaxID=399045 RepID=A0A7R9GFF1_9CRUS|nr:unnamed protein product [Notodromas monacha]CAG0920638.1 unnamed protein product [Notodromas monacha]
MQKEDFDKLKYVWEKWRDVSGRAVRQQFIEYANLTNQGALVNELKDGGELWLRPYESENFQEQIAKLYDQLSPFYQELHAYMTRYKFFFTLAVLACVGHISVESAKKTYPLRDLSVDELKAYKDTYSEKYRSEVNKQAEAEWAFQTNITDYNSEVQVNSSLELSAWLKQEWVSSISQFNLSILDVPEHADLRRWYASVEVLGIPALDDTDLAKWSQIITSMTSLYGSARICPFDNQDCNPNTDPTWSLEPDLENIFLNSMQKEDFDKLKYVWEKWRDVSGRAVRQQFIEYANLTNQGALVNELKDGGELWLRPYESENFQEQIAKLYDQLSPFYQELHAYVRYKLSQHYGADKVSPTGPIPAHILGNMWAQGWQAIFPIVSEFNSSSLDVTGAMVEQGYTVKKMFETSDNFFTGLGLESLDTAALDFYGDSMLEKPADREVVCHASAWDFMKKNKNPGDFRIKMCTSVDMDDLITIHHEMGHIQYYMQYVEQNPLFREGANPGFHEAIGDTLALSVATPVHLKKIGLLDPNFELDENSQLGFLLRMAMEKVAFLPFGYIMDLYRWKVFNGSIATENLNQEWWNLRETYQGVQSPVPRTEMDFDPGAKYHVVNDVPYIRYFVAHVLQFDFHQTLCELAGQFNPSKPDEKPLHECDIDGDKTNAGAKLKVLLQAGSSKHWAETLEGLTGHSEMTVDPLLNYFKPLRDYLKQQIALHNIPVGWSSAASESEVVPIVVGAIIATIAVATLIAFVFVRRRKARENRA